MIKLRWDNSATSSRWVILDVEGKYELGTAVVETISTGDIVIEANVEVNGRLGRAKRSFFEDDFNRLGRFEAVFLVARVAYLNAKESGAH